MNDCLIVTPCSNLPNITNNVKTQISPSAIMVIKGNFSLNSESRLIWMSLPFFNPRLLYKILPFLLLTYLLISGGYLIVYAVQCIQTYIKAFVSRQRIEHS